MQDLNQGHVTPQFVLLANMTPCLPGGEHKHLLQGVFTPYLFLSWGQSDTFWFVSSVMPGTTPCKQQTLVLTIGFTTPRKQSWRNSC